MEWKIESGPHFLEQEGSWRLFADGKRTVPEYASRVRARASPLSSLASRLGRDEVKKDLVATRKHAESADGSRSR